MVAPYDLKYDDLIIEAFASVPPGSMNGNIINFIYKIKWYRTAIRSPVSPSGVKGEIADLEYKIDHLDEIGRWKPRDMK